MERRNLRTKSLGATIVYRLTEEVEGPKEREEPGVGERTERRWMASGPYFSAPETCFVEDSFSID